MWTVGLAGTLKMNQIAHSGPHGASARGARAGKDWMGQRKP